VVAILSGGNVDPLLLLRIIQHGMRADGRYLELRLRIPDRPGSLAAVLACVSGLGANVLNVEHSRISDALALGEVELALNLETRGLEHCERVTAGLLRAGFMAF
jgi:threonine dehydratase